MLLLLWESVIVLCSCTLLCVHSSFAIILMGKRELVALLSLSSWCLVIVVWLFLTVPWVCLHFVIVVFSDHTHLLFLPFHFLWIRSRRYIFNYKPYFPWKGRKILQNLMSTIFVIGALTLSPPVTTFVIYSSCLLMFLDSLYCKQYEPRSDCCLGRILIRVHIVCFHEKIQSEVHLNIGSKQQTTFSGQ